MSKFIEIYILTGRLTFMSVEKKTCVGLCLQVKLTKYVCKTFQRPHRFTTNLNVDLNEIYFISQKKLLLS